MFIQINRDAKKRSSQNNNNRTEKIPVIKLPESELECNDARTNKIGNEKDLILNFGSD